MTKKIIVFASGSGSNFQTLIDCVEHGEINAKISCLVVDRVCASVDRAIKHGIDFYVVNRKNDVSRNIRVLSEICQDVDLIVCAGYLSIIPQSLVAQLPQKIINIHPSLLPLYGGKGMYGVRVHQEVVNAGDKKSGCTVHYVDAGVDTGEIIEQRIVCVNECDTAEELQKKVLIEEHALLRDVVVKLLK